MCCEGSARECVSVSVSRTDVVTDCQSLNDVYRLIFFQEKRRFTDDSGHGDLRTHGHTRNKTKTRHDTDVKSKQQLFSVTNRTVVNSHN